MDEFRAQKNGEKFPAGKKLSVLKRTVKNSPQEKNCSMLSYVA
jgi:hypothetical protein